VQKKGRFTAEWIAQLKQSISLVDVASENVELRKTGNRYMGRCPFHGDRSPSFSVNKDFYYCFGCKETGDVISFVTKLHGLSFEEACEDLAEKAKLPIPEATVSSEEERAMYLRRVRLQKAARLNLFASVQFYHKNYIKGSESPLFQEARDYVKNRGISQQTIENFQVGVAGAQHDALVQFLTQAKAPLDIATEFGLIRPSQRQAGNYDFFRERVLFPLIDVRGRVCGFGGRILPSVAARPSEMKLPKYLNTAESDLFQKSKFLYGLFQAKRSIRETETVIVVEGYFDVISLHQAGFENVVATCGTSLTEEHLKVLSRLAKKVIVFFDRDSAGINATTKAMEMGLRLGMMLYGIPYESELDFDEFLILNPMLHLEKMRGWVTQSFPLVDHLIEQELKASESDVEKRTQAIKQITHWLESYVDPVGRSLRIDQLIQKWRIPVAALGALGAQVNQRPPANRNQRGGPHAIPQGHPTPLPTGNQISASSDGVPVRRRPISNPDRQLLQFLVKFNDFGSYFLEARKQMHEKDTLSVLFDDTEVQAWVQKMNEDPSGFSRLKLAPETLVADAISQELRSVIMEGLLQESVAGEAEQLKILLRRGIHKSWARFSQRLKQEMAAVDAAQDTEKFRELSQQFLDLQRKLKDFEDSYVSGKHTE
jgi:DNA primase